ncbi:uncharacterized protein LOC121680347 isoform X2 [Alosa sapidissima]|uniref:uncharacterized protein LOC121680347 isoform X2 n=1 Tax=Alosa sapidissima TaxID=34773 RepID=UPI001C09941F|nr:uncharacterized protein LOC121680347 isoform X2 [Alosa sapidissima]
MACSPAPCDKNNVLDYLLCSEPTHVRIAVEVLILLTQESKRCLVESILRAERKNDCIRVLTHILCSADHWLCSSAAYLFGVLMESETIRQTLKKCSHESNGSLVAVLGQLLTKDDPDIVMNSAGAIASLVESSEGRQWLLGQPEVLGQVLESLSHLLGHARESMVNSAALILAQLSLCEEACHSLLSQPSATRTLSRLAQCLAHSDTDTAMNAAFAVGRLCGSEQGRTLILAQAREHQLVSSLQALLCSGAGPEPGQTACFALSCLATEEDGHALVLDSPSFPGLMDGLLQLLQRPEHDSTWFAALTAKVLVSRPRGVLRVREHGLLEKHLQALSLSPSSGPELQEELNACLRKLQRLPKPVPVTVHLLLQGPCRVSWEKCTPESGLEVTYCLQDRDTVLYHGPLCNTTIPPSTFLRGDRPALSLRLSHSTSDGDVSPLSEAVVVESDRAGLRPGPPRELRVIGCTASQVRLRWVAPEGEQRLKGYHVYRGDTLVDTTAEPGVIVSGLSPSTQYRLRVCALGLGDATGPFAEVEASTADAQDHAPSVLTVVVLGRHELHVCWGAPLAPLGRLFNYELRMNGDVAYLGTERVHTARRLASNTAYTCTVTAITSRGRCECQPVTKRTARDEYQHTQRCLYSPSRQTAGPSPLAREASAVSEKVKKSHSPPKHLPKVQLTGYHHRRATPIRDRHRHSPSAEQGPASESTQKASQGLVSGFDVRALLERGEMGAEVEQCPLMVPLRCPLSRRSKTEINLWAQPSLMNGALITPKISPVTVYENENKTFVPEPLLQWSATKRGLEKRGRLPLINPHSCSVRTIQPVSYSWSDLDRTGHHSNRAIRNRIMTRPRALSEARARHHHTTLRKTSI